MTTEKMNTETTIINSENYITEEPYYLATGDEIEVFNSALAEKIPVLLKGPTGCGKTRFMEYMSWYNKLPLITVSCHDDLTTSDLVGRYLIQNDTTIWQDGPLTTAVRNGCICYLDEVVEARKDTTVVIHPLCDDRRILPLEKRGEILKAAPDFFLTISYNPGYQSAVKDLKPSTRQRFLSIDFSYPPEDAETRIVHEETALPTEMAQRLVKLASMTRNLVGNGLEEGASTRLLVHTAKLINRGFDPKIACRYGIADVLSDDSETLGLLHDMIETLF
ncbi:CbbQ/NirQ/NorQ/GpvN family protein [uncultured Cocleimonas sp.]|uniref:CbbQ/NirQ/NorQ/GpvN family protein n=1 Tax=uncultured Cocleimonas sp. TaxID=1051587 RepID=UPI002638015C|nr:CbbQ/NirQ/NorQ/GpvN family protein [uncultured Cocleimonas sp.]